MNDLKPGIDGMVPFGVLTDSDCCPPSFCDVDSCQLATSFIGLLPKGPMWDAAKYKARITINRYKDCDACWTCDHCPSLVDYAIHVGQLTANAITGPIWRAFRDSDPFTVRDATSSWLDRLQWQDCFRTLCRGSSMGELTPVEIMTDCGPQQVDIPIVGEYKIAFESALIKSLTRMNLGLIKNMAAVNFVIEPLKVQAVPVMDGDVCETGRACITFEKTADHFDGVAKDACGNATPIQAWIDRDIAGLPPQLAKYIWPGHLAAECIVRSLLSHVPKFCVIRTAQTPD